MPHHLLVCKELGELLGVLAHPHRIRIVEELRHGERDVNTMQAILEVSHSSVSQHLAVLRAHRIVAERREGRHVFYHLRQPDLARWLIEGTRFLEDDQTHSETIRQAIQIVRAEWQEE
ncbi:MAG: ArsR/SmtB family transcription factor [Gemmataceae bacterium]